MPDALILYTTDSRLFNFDYSAMPEVVGGDTLSSATVTSNPTGLTIGTPSVSSPKVQVLLSGGTAGTTYTVICVATTAAGRKLTGEGVLYCSS